MRRTGVLLVTLALGVAGLTGCSGGDDKYCGLIKDADSDKSLSGSEFLDDPNAVKKASAKLKEIEAAAPSDVQDEWKTLNGVMDLASQDLAKADPKEVQEKTKNLDSALQTLQKDTKDRCGLDVNMAG